jgi:DNA-binding CsgD family transcriptional regulator/PAS domain-containing protein
MWDAEDLSTLIGEIYDAALDPALWPAVLEQSSKFVGGCAAGIYSKDSVSKSADINPAYTFGAERRAQQIYVDHYARIDPTTTGHFFFGVGEIVTTADILPHEEFLETRFYKEWVKPQGWIDAVSSLLEKSAASYSILSVFRHERDGPADDACRRRMSLLVPHFRRSVLIGKTIQLKAAEADAFADTLNALSAGVFLVDPAGRVLRANVKGHALLAEERVLRATGGRLVATDSSADQALRTAFAAAEFGDASLGTQAIAVPLAGGEQRLIAHVLPLTSGARRKAGMGGSAVAAIFVRSAELDTPAAPEVIAKLYGLTPSELRVLLAVFESGGVPNVAEALGISKATAKTHLRRLFEKTGTGRQADLVKLVAGFSVAH